MADKLSPNGHDASKPGSNGPAPLTLDEFLALYQEREEAKSEHAAAVEACKAPKKRVKEAEQDIAARMSIEAFERTMEDILKPSYQREQEQAEYLRNMAWMGKPVPIGGQAAFDFAAKEAGAGELKRIEAEGYAAGRAGHAADTNTYTPGDERFARFETSYKRGFDEFMDEQKERAEALGSEPGKPDGRRGRVMSEEQKAAMKAGREAAAARKAGATA